MLSFLPSFSRHLPLLQAGREKSPAFNKLSEGLSGDHVPFLSGALMPDVKDFDQGTSSMLPLGLSRKSEKTRMSSDTMMKQAEMGLLRKIMKLPLEISRA